MSDTKALQLAVRAIEGFRIKNADLERQLAEAQGERDALMKAGVTDYSKFTGTNRVDCHFCNGVWRTEEPAKHKSTCPLDRILRGTKEEATR